MYLIVIDPDADRGQAILRLPMIKALMNANNAGFEGDMAFITANAESLVKKLEMLIENLTPPEPVENVNLLQRILRF